MKRIRTVSTQKKKKSSQKQDEKITDPLKIRQSLSIIQHSYASVVIWEDSIGVKPVNTFIDQVNKKESSFQIEFPHDLSVEAKENWKELEEDLDQGNVECHFLVFLKRGGILGFVAPLKEFEVTDEEQFEAKFGFPSALFKLKRRKEERFEIPGGYDILTEFRDPRGHQRLMQKRVFDISQSGFSFLISKGLAIQFPKNLLLSQMKISLRGQKVVFGAQIKSKTLMYAGTMRECYKVGLEFKKMSDKDKELISNYILENQIQYFSHLT